MSQIKPSSHNCVLICWRNMRLLTLSLILVMFSRTTSEVSSLFLIIHSRLHYLVISCIEAHTTKNIWLRTTKINKRAFQKDVYHPLVDRWGGSFTALPFMAPFLGPHPPPSWHPWTAPSPLVNRMNHRHV